MGVSGRVMLRALIAGERDPEVLAELAGASWSDFVFVSRVLDGLAVTSAGRYHDHLRRHEGRWRLILREIAFMGETPR